MHPAPSIIFFTVFSGLGFGLMAWIGAGFAPDAALAVAALSLLALALASAGLLASLFHLGQPRRFLKAFSQWRSSWLSREAVLAMATMTSFALYAALWSLAGLRLAPLGALAGLLALATVGATSMIYAQMRSVPRWRSPLTPAIFLAAALAGGALLAGASRPAAPLLALLGLMQIADWILGDRRFARAGATLAAATGLGGLGRLRLLEPPHTGGNYLTREMVHVIGRKHAAKLRAIGLLLAVALPLAGILAARDPGPTILAPVALAHIGGMIVLRWLFFAQAEHSVGLYYGRR